MKKSDANKLRKWCDKLTAMRDDCEELMADYQDIYDGKSEKFQESEKGEEMQNEIELLENIHINLDSAADSIAAIVELE